MNTASSARLSSSAISGSNCWKARTPTSSPSLKTVIRSQISKTSSSRWETNTIAVPWSRSLRVIANRSFTSFGVNAAVEKVRGGKNVVIATPTASGKTLTYNLPVVERLLQDPGGKALYLFPLKALEQDQWKAFQELVKPFQTQFPFKAEIYDGDTSSYRRRKIRESVPQVLISNPDMVHLSLLPFHAQWEAFFRNLRFVVIDQLHTYKGIFGSHLAQVLRRGARRHFAARPHHMIPSAEAVTPPGRLVHLFRRALEQIGDGGHVAADHLVRSQGFHSSANHEGINVAS